MELSSKALEKLKALEGFCAHIYYDMAGCATIGYGHKLKDGEAFQTISKSGACELLQEDCRDAVEAVNDLVRVPLEQHQFDALVIFAYNVGRYAFATSTLLKCLNLLRYDAVPGQLAKWVNAGGQRLEGLVRRRNVEIAMWKGDSNA